VAEVIQASCEIAALNPAQARVASIAAGFRKRHLGRMRFISVLSVSLALAACASAPAAPASPSAPAASAGGGSRVAQMLHAAGRQDAPTRADLERALGQPDVARQDGAGVALTYRLESCALLLLFEADSRNAFRLTRAHPGARQAGAAAPSLDRCAAEAERR
jgi:hypothetical protein